MSGNSLWLYSPVSTSWSQYQTGHFLIIVQPWSIIKTEAFPYPRDKLLCLTGLSVRFDTKINFLYRSIRGITLLPVVVCLCFTLCDCAPSWSSFTLWTASNLSAAPQSDMQSEWSTGHSWCWWSTSTHRILSAMHKRQPLCTDNTESHRKACEIIFITSSSSSTSSSTSS